jgi:hypothetical protein
LSRRNERNDGNDAENCDSHHRKRKPPGCGDGNRFVFKLRHGLRLRRLGDGVGRIGLFVGLCRRRRPDRNAARSAEIQ